MSQIVGYGFSALGALYVAAPQLLWTLKFFPAGATGQDSKEFLYFLRYFGITLVVLGLWLARHIPKDCAVATWGLGFAAIDQFVWGEPGPYALFLAALGLSVLFLKNFSAPGGNNTTTTARSVSAVADAVLALVAVGIATYDWWTVFCPACGLSELIVGYSVPAPAVKGIVKLGAEDKYFVLVFRSAAALTGGAFCSWFLEDQNKDNRAFGFLETAVAWVVLAVKAYGFSIAAPTPAVLALAAAYFIGAELKELNGARLLDSKHLIFINDFVDSLTGNGPAKSASPAAAPKRKASSKRN
jgi:hypothetical protein